MTKDLTRGKAMFATNITGVANFIASAAMMVDELGITLESGTDFSVYKTELQGLAGRGALIPVFDPDSTTFDENDAFWIIGRDDNQEIVHTQAVRMFDLGKDHLAAFLEPRMEEFTPTTWAFDEELSDFVAAPGSLEVKGKVCCHGEFWIKGGPQGFRTKGLAIFLTRLGMALSAMKWSPDYVFALMQSLTICKGLAARAGFLHTAQTNLYWEVPDYPENLEVWMTWVSRNDINYLMKIPPEKLCRQLTGKDFTKTPSRPAKIA